MITGARYQIAVDGQPRSNRDHHVRGRRIFQVQKSQAADLVSHQVAFDAELVPRSA
jgi:hypothetical protein